MADILVGTSGYSYKDWIGPFYPPGARESDFLPFYAGEFPFVELNFSYYTMPKADLITRLIDKTPEGFLFAIKAHRSLTHEKTTADLPKNGILFREGIAPLVEQHRLAAVLLQFPYSFHYTPDNRTYLDAFLSNMSGLPVAVEFRNAEWVNERVREGLTTRRAAFVNVDQPDLPHLIRPGAVVTADPAYLRFHGRNKKNWWTGDNVSRYDYLYSDDELVSWLDHIRSLAAASKLLLVTFNNHSRGQAIHNARRLRELLQSRGFLAR
ncbi:MAG TPA: DUF72 domain-containing protein [Spirochaetia bacterium]|nr:DUF72 domain-containing protein [Spirochaetia bacterium]